MCISHTPEYWHRPAPLNLCHHLLPTRLPLRQGIHTDLPTEVNAPILSVALTPTKCLYHASGRAVEQQVVQALREHMLLRLSESPADQPALLLSAPYRVLPACQDLLPAAVTSEQSGCFYY